MEREPNELDYSIEELESLGVIPFTLKKDSLTDEYIITWTTVKSHFPEEMQDSKTVTRYVLDNAKKVGVDEIMMPDQPKDGEKCHEITYEEVINYYKSSIAHRDNSIWNEIQKCDSLFMTRETHYEVLESTGRSISLVFPAADCAIVRMYDKKKDVIGITHSGIPHTTKNVIKDMVEYMKDHFKSNPEDIVVFVGAFALDGMIWDKYPPFAEENPEIWKDYIKKIDDTHYDIKFGDKIYDQLIETGLSKENIYFDKDNTVTNEDYFSNNRIRLQGDRLGRNLFGISFDSLPIYENVEQGKTKTRLR